MLRRIFFTIVKGWQYRHALYQIMKMQKAVDINQVDLMHQRKKFGSEVLVLDFDGVLASHGKVKPALDVTHFLSKTKDNFLKGNIFILTNNPKEKRLQHIQEHYPHINMHTASKKKPYPDGLLEIAEKTKHPPESILLIDDRLLTGALASCLAKTAFVYISRPKRNFLYSPIKETFFAFLRFTEKMLIRIIGWL